MGLSFGIGLFELIVAGISLSYKNWNATVAWLVASVTLVAFRNGRGSCAKGSCWR